MSETTDPKEPTLDKRIEAVADRMIDAIGMAASDTMGLPDDARVEAYRDNRRDLAGIVRSIAELALEIPIPDRVFRLPSVDWSLSEILSKATAAGKTNAKYNIREAIPRDVAGRDGVLRPEPIDAADTDTAAEPNTQPCGECATFSPDGDLDPELYGQCESGKHCASNIETDCRDFNQKPFVNLHLALPPEPIAVEDITPGWYFAVYGDPVDTSLMFLSEGSVATKDISENFRWYRAPSPEQLMAMCGETKEARLDAQAEIRRYVAELALRGSELEEAESNVRYLQAENAKLKKQKATASGLDDQEILALGGARDVCRDAAKGKDVRDDRAGIWLNSWAWRIQGIINKSPQGPKPPTDKRVEVLETANARLEGVIASQEKANDLLSAEAETFRLRLGHAEKENAEIKSRPKLKATPHIITEPVCPSCGSNGYSWEFPTTPMPSSMITCKHCAMSITLSTYKRLRQLEGMIGGYREAIGEGWVGMAVQLADPDSSPEQSKPSPDIEP